VRLDDDERREEGREEGGSYKRRLDCY